ncbi:MAG: hypothetical protein IRZ08_21190, partial [Frankia sp.]|nr:hypothetical protein [Frankia sp.]
PPLGAAYQRLAPVPPRTLAVPETAPAAYRIADAAIAGGTAARPDKPTGS